MDNSPKRPFWSSASFRVQVLSSSKQTGSFPFFWFCHARHPLADCLFWLLPYIHQLAAWWAPKFQCIWVFLGETWGNAFFVGLVQPSIILKCCKISVKLGCLECFNLYDQQKNTATSKNILFSHWFSIMYASLFFMLWLQISALVPVSTQGRVLYGPGYSVSSWLLTSLDHTRS